MKISILLLSLLVPADAQTSVQRTIGSAPPQETSGRAVAGASSDAQIRAAVAAYRKSWDQMSDKVRKSILSHGGQTPEQYERLLRQGSTRIPAAVNGAEQSPKSADSDLDLDVLHTMKTSTQDLNIIRDGNLRRVQTPGCAPELASRIADLKSRLELQESSLRVEETPPETAPRKTAARAGSSAAVADDSFKAPTRSPASSPTSGETADTKNSQLDAVLGLSTGETPAVKPAAAKPADNGVDRKQAELEIARIQAELDRLTSACKAAK
jgi:hypothetical protein